MNSQQPLAMTPQDLIDLIMHPDGLNALDPERLALMLGQAFAAIGTAGVPVDVIPSLRRGYQYACTRLDIHSRLRVLDRLGERLETNPNPAQPWLLIALDDPDPEVVAMAVLNLALALTPDPDDELSGVRDLLAHVATIDDQARKAGFIAGLLMLGDRRVGPILDSAWRLLDDDGQKKLATLTLAPATVTLIDFYLSWLDDGMTTGDDPVVNALVESMIRLADTTTGIVDLARSFSARLWRDRLSLVVLQSWAVREYGAIIAPRLLDLAAREPEPEWVDRMFLAWSIDSLTPRRFNTTSAREPRSGRSTPRQSAVDSLLKEIGGKAGQPHRRGTCHRCGRLREEGSGTLCAACHDAALVEIAARRGVRGIASEAWADDYPTTEHPIWTVLERTLDRKSRGESVEDVYPILDELDLYKTIRVNDDGGQWAIERIALPHASRERVWVTRWNERSAPIFLASFDGPDRERRVAELAEAISTPDARQRRMNPPTAPTSTPVAPPPPTSQVRAPAPPPAAPPPRPTPASPAGAGVPIIIDPTVPLLCSRCGTRFRSEVPRCPACLQRLDDAIAQAHGGMSPLAAGLSPDDLLPAEDAMPDPIPWTAILAGGIASLIVAFIVAFIYHSTGSGLLFLFPAAIGVTGGFIAAVAALRRNSLFRPSYVGIPIAIGLIAYGATLWFGYELVVSDLEDNGYTDVRERLPFGAYVRFMAEQPISITRRGQVYAGQAGDTSSNYGLWTLEAAIAAGAGYWGWRRAIRYVYTQRAEHG